VDYDGIIPDGFDVIELPAAKYLMFQGEPFAEEDYEQAIEEVWEAEKKYNHQLLDMSGTRIILEFSWSPLVREGTLSLFRSSLCK